MASKPPGLTSTNAGREPARPLRVASRFSLPKVKFCSDPQNVLYVLNKVLVIIEALTLSEGGVGWTEEEMELRFNR